MRPWSLLALAVGLGSPGGCGAPSFTCSDDNHCTLAEGGVCRPGGACSYPDPTCPSNHRYSEHAGSRAGQCVPQSGGSDESGVGTSSTSGGGTTEAADTSTDTTDAPPDPCAGVDCGPHGVCEPVDATPTCACDTGYVALDLQCVEPQCPGTACYWVDAQRGHDTNPGTQAAPVRSLARAAQFVPRLAPGEAIVLRRGQTWSEPLMVADAAGSEDDPIIIGSWGDDTAAAPRIEGPVTVTGGEGVQLFDLRVRNALGVAITLSGTRHATVLGCEIVESQDGCIVVDNGSEYTALVDNRLRDCGSTHGIGLVAGGRPLGDHHWVLDNRIDAEGTISAIHIGANAADDIKVVRNYLQGSIDRGLTSRVGGRGWLLSNVVAQAGDFNDAAIDHQGAGEVIARGNTILDAELPVYLAGRGQWALNTIVHDDPLAAVTVTADAEQWTIEGNLVAAGDAVALRVDQLGDVSSERNVYAWGPGRACALQAEGMVIDLPGWQALGQGTDSRCEAVAGLSIPAAIESTHTWGDELLDAATPDPGWPGCDEPIGAWDCEGQPRVDALPAFDDYGHGWLGPSVVGDRFPPAP